MRRLRPLRTRVGPRLGDPPLGPTVDGPASGTYGLAYARVLCDDALVDKGGRAPDTDFDVRLPVRTPRLDGPARVMGDEVIAPPVPVRKSAGDSTRTPPSELSRDICPNETVAVRDRIRVGTGVVEL